MKHLVKFPLDDGSTVIFEVDEPETDGTLENALDSVLSMPKGIINKLHTGHINAWDDLWSPGSLRKLIPKQLQQLTVTYLVKSVLNSEPDSASAFIFV